VREHFRWEQRLSDEAFPLLLAGLLPPSLARRETLPSADELGRLLVARWQALPGSAWACWLREGSERLIRGQSEAIRLVQAAEDLLASCRVDPPMH
jgi:hypothetical protein